MREDFDLAVLGSGFGGSLLAMAARKLGLSVVMLEKGSHPRFAIGESSSPLANVLLEELCDEYDLPALRPLSKWGTWRRERPELACGLKRGFTFLGQTFGEPFSPAPDRRNQLLVAASPRDEIADTHWYRAELDEFLAHQARQIGVELVDRIVLDVAATDTEGIRLEGSRFGNRVSIRAKLAVDASGPRGALFRLLGLAERSFPDFPATQALFTHFEGVERLDESAALDFRGAPYPADDAAVHHVFEGGWIWVLRFSNGITSAGFAATDTLAAGLDLQEPEGAWRRLLSRLPTVRDQFAGARRILPWIHTPRLSFRSVETAGERWALLPSASAFVDPLLSTGIPLTLLGVKRFAAAIRDLWGSARFPARIAAEAQKGLTEADAVSSLVAALYASFDDFPVFSALTMLYFAAASYSETARRLGRAELAPSFLLHEGPGFGAEFRRICATARRSRDLRASPPARRELLESIRRAIDPINVAGLCDPARRNWYPVEAEDLLGSARKLGTSREEVAAMLQRTEFAAR